MTAGVVGDPLALVGRVIEQAVSQLMPAEAMADVGAGAADEVLATALGNRLARMISGGGEADTSGPAEREPASEWLSHYHELLDRNSTVAAGSGHAIAGAASATARSAPAPGRPGGRSRTSGCSRRTCCPRSRRWRLHAYRRTRRRRKTTTKQQRSELCPAHGLTMRRWSRAGAVTLRSRHLGMMSPK